MSREDRSYRFDPRRGCSTKFSPGTRNFLVCARRPGDNVEERRQDLPPHRASCECGGKRGKGEEDSYVYARPLVLPSQIHEANIGRKNGVEEVKEPATILLLPRYRSTRFPPHSMIPLVLFASISKRRDHATCSWKENGIIPFFDFEFLFEGIRWKTLPSGSEWSKIAVHGGWIVTLLLGWWVKRKTTVKEVQRATRGGGILRQRSTTVGISVGKFTVSTLDSTHIRAHKSETRASLAVS